MYIILKQEMVQNDLIDLNIISEHKTYTACTKIN